MMKNRNALVVLGAWALAFSLLACELDTPRPMEAELESRSLDAGGLLLTEEIAPRLSEAQALARVDELLKEEQAEEVGAQEEDVAMVEQGDLALALAFKHVDAEPCDHVATAKSLLAEGDRAQAMLELEKALYDKPRDKQAAMLLGVIARQSGDDDLATDAFMLAAEISPDDDLPWVQMARLTLEQGQIDDAEQMLRKALKLKSDRAESFNLLGRVWLGRSHWQRAILNFKQAMKLRPDSVFYRNNLGYSFLLMRDFGRAVETLEPLAQNTDVPVFMLNNLGLAYEGVGRIQDALAQFKSASERSPGYLKSKLNLERLVQVAKASAELTEATPATGTATENGSDVILPDGE